MHIALLSPAVGTGNIGDHFIEMGIRRMLSDEVVFSRFTIRRPLKAEEIDAINTTDGCLICGTNLYQHQWHSALTPEHLDRIHVPIIPFGLGSSAQTLADTEVGETTRHMIRAIHSRCVCGSVRDAHTMQVVFNVGVVNAVQTGCPVLFWSQQSSLPAIRPIKRDRIIVTARNWLMHRWPENIDHPVQIALFQRLFAQLREYDLVFAVHEEYDERLIKFLDLPEKLVFRSEHAEDYIDLYTDPQNVVFAMRLHAGMLALANGVPAVLVGHDTRTYAFCDLMDTDYIELFDTQAAEKSIERLKDIMEGNVTPFDRMQAPYRQLWLSMADFMQANGLPARSHPVG
jgi:hypothetical protein